MHLSQSAALLITSLSLATASAQSIASSYNSAAQTWTSAAALLCQTVPWAGFKDWRQFGFSCSLRTKCGKIASMHHGTC